MPFRMAETESVAVVKVIGLGGGGGNAINTMVDNKLQGVEFIVANTDKQALDQSKADICIQLGPSITKGLGAGADPETGAQSAHESMEEVKEGLLGRDEPRFSPLVLAPRFDVAGLDGASHVGHPGALVDGTRSYNFEDIRSGIWELDGALATPNPIYYTDDGRRQLNLQMVFKHCIPSRSLRKLVSQSG